MGFSRRMGLGMALAIACLATPRVEAQQAPPGVDATRLRICAGGARGNYTFAANEIAQRVSKADFPGGVQVITTGGSLDNLRRLEAGECDVGLAQSDVTSLFQAERAGSPDALVPFSKLYEEYVHVLCPIASGWEDVGDIGKAAQSGRGARMIVGPDGSGGAETWRAMRQADVKLYERVERLPNDVGRASLGMVRDSNNTCMLWVSGLNSGDMVAADVMSVTNPARRPTMRLMDVNASRIRDLKGPNGQPMYQMRTIERTPATANNPGLYGNLIYDGWGADSVTVATVDAVLMMRAPYRTALRDKADGLMQAIGDASPSIWARVSPRQGR